MKGEALVKALAQLGRDPHEEVERLLVQEGASPNTVDGGGRSALYLSAWAGHAASTQTLLRLGAVVDAPNPPAGRTTPPVSAGVYRSCTAGVSIVSIPIVPVTMSID